MITEIKLLVLAVTLALAGSLGSLGYYKVKQIGYAEAEAKYVKIIGENNKAISLKITDLEKASRSLVQVTEANNAALTQNIGKIVLGLNGKTLTIIKDGKCIPTKEFSDSFGKLNSAVNQSIRGSGK